MLSQGFVAARSHFLPSLIHLVSPKYLGVTCCGTLSSKSNRHDHSHLHQEAVTTGKGPSRSGDISPQMRRCLPVLVPASSSQLCVLCHLLGVFRGAGGGEEVLVYSS